MPKTFSIYLIPFLPLNSVTIKKRMYVNWLTKCEDQHESINIKENVSVFYPLFSITPFDAKLIDIGNH